MKSPEELGDAAALQTANLIRQLLQEQSRVRIVLSTGASQFEFFRALSNIKIDWSRVDMFHLDEYVALPERHPASFRRYLRERFLSFASEAKAHLIDGEGGIKEEIDRLTSELRQAPIDLALIGIGENAHIAFNDPPADFQSPDAFKIVALDEDCKAQQVREGWFPSLEAVPDQAITMTVHQIMQSRTILSCVPGQVKANAVRSTLTSGVTERVPASILTTHPDWTLLLDEASASEMRELL
jgi:glucosamine-6-phosphate deaminase